MNTSELDRIIIENLADLDATATHIASLEARVWHALSEIAEGWAKGAKWAYRESGEDDDDVWVARPDWQDRAEISQWIYLDWGPDDDGSAGAGSPFFDLSRLAGAAGGRLCWWGGL